MGDLEATISALRQRLSAAEAAHEDKASDVVQAAVQEATTALREQLEKTTVRSRDDGVWSAQTTRQSNADVYVLDLLPNARHHCVMPKHWQPRQLQSSGDCRAHSHKP